MSNCVGISYIKWMFLSAENGENFVTFEKIKKWLDLMQQMGNWIFFSVECSLALT